MFYTLFITCRWILDWKKKKKSERTNEQSEKWEKMQDSRHAFIDADAILSVSIPWSIQRQCFIENETTKRTNRNEMTNKHPKTMMVFGIILIVIFCRGKRSWANQEMKRSNEIRIVRWLILHWKRFNGKIYFSLLSSSISVKNWWKKLFRFYFILYAVFYLTMVNLISYQITIRKFWVFSIL